MMTLAGNRHGRITVELTLLLGNHVKKAGLGVLVAAETGFLLSRDPDTVRAPDIAFIRKERSGAPPDDGYVIGAPDLAVEVLSPDDRAGAVKSKVRDWLDAGCALVWVVDPKKLSVTAHRRGGARLLTGQDVLGGEDVVPGFEIRVAEIFPA